MPSDLHASPFTITSDYISRDRAAYSEEAARVKIDFIIDLVS